MVYFNKDIGTRYTLISSQDYVKTFEFEFDLGSEFVHLYLCLLLKCLMLSNVRQVQNISNHSLLNLKKCELYNKECFQCISC